MFQNVLIFLFFILTQFLTTEQAIIDDPCHGAHEIYNACNHGCEPHCPEMPMHGCDPVLMCLKTCLCTEGYLRDRQAGVCVRPQNCTPPENQNIE